MGENSLPLPGSIDLARPHGTAQTVLENLHEWVVTVDHKRLGVLYVLYGIFFLLVGGAEAIAIRIQLASPLSPFMSAQVYNRFFTMHGTTMVFLVGMTIVFGFANYLVPLQI